MEIELVENKDKSDIIEDHGNTHVILIEEEEEREQNKKEEEEKKEKKKKRKKDSKVKEFFKKYILANIGMIIYTICSLVLILLFRYVAVWDIDWKGWYTITVLILILAWLLREVASPDLVMVTGMALLVVGTIVTPKQALSGFGNEAVVTIGFLLIVSKGIEKTNGLGRLLRHVLGSPKNLYIAYLRMMVKKKKKKIIYLLFSSNEDSFLNFFNNI